MRTARHLTVVFAAAALTMPVFAQQAQAQKKEDTKKAPEIQRETVAKPMTEKQKRRQQERLRKELETPFKNWLNQDVGYIISDEERKAFKGFSTDEEREQFIEDDAVPRG